MNSLSIEDITIKQARELVAIFGFNQTAPAATATARHPMVGSYVIARCYAAGVHAGTVESVDGENVILVNSRRLWSWKANNGVALSGVAQAGLKSGSCKVDVVNPLIYLTGV